MGLGPGRPPVGRCEKLTGAPDGSTRMPRARARARPKAAGHTNGSQGREPKPASAQAAGWRCCPSAGRPAKSSWNALPAGLRAPTPIPRRRLTLVLTGCNSDITTGQACQTVGAPDGQIEGQFIATLGLVSDGSKPSVGLDLRQAHGVELLELECGGRVFMLGSIIAPITPADKMSSTSKLAFKVKKGRRAPKASKASRPKCQKSTAAPPACSSPSRSAGKNGSRSKRCAR